MRDLLQRIELMTDPDWSITADDSQKLASGEWQTVDARKIDDVAALAAITSVEASQRQPPDSALKDLGQRWVTATAQYYSSVADLRTALSRRSQEGIQASLARVDASQALLSSLRERCVADCTCMPAAPTSEYELSFEELIYLEQLEAADVALDYPLIMMRAAAEAGGRGGSSPSPSLPLELLPRLVRVCVAWTYGPAPTGRLQQIGARWDTAMGYTRQVADLLQQIPTSDPDVMARLRVVLQLAATEFREVRTAIDSFGRLQRILPNNSLAALLLHPSRNST